MVLMEHSDKGAKHAVENRYIAYENVKQLLKVNSRNRNVSPGGGMWMEKATNITAEL